MKKHFEHELDDVYFSVQSDSDLFKYQDLI